MAVRAVLGQEFKFAAAVARYTHFLCHNLDLVVVAGKADELTLYSVFDFFTT